MQCPTEENTMQVEEHERRRKILNLILQGKCDTLLDDIAHAMRERKVQISRDLFRELRIGDRVQIEGNIKPRYMAGLVGTVVDKRQSKVELEFAEPVGRFGRRVICPVTSITKIGTGQ
jgi:ribosomal protein L21E